MLGWIHPNRVQIAVAQEQHVAAGREAAERRLLRYHALRAGRQRDRHHRRIVGRRPPPGGKDGLIVEPVGPSIGRALGERDGNCGPPARRGDAHQRTSPIWGKDDLVRRHPCAPDACLRRAKHLWLGTIASCDPHLLETALSEEGDPVSVGRKERTVRAFRAGKRHRVEPVHLAQKQSDVGRRASHVDEALSVR